MVLIVYGVYEYILRKGNVSFVKRNEVVKLSIVLYPPCRKPVATYTYTTWLGQKQWAVTLANHSTLTGHCAICRSEVENTDYPHYSRCEISRHWFWRSVATPHRHSLPVLKSISPPVLGRRLSFTFVGKLDIEEISPSRSAQGNICPAWPIMSVIVSLDCQVPLYLTLLISRPITRINVTLLKGRHAQIC